MVPWCLKNWQIISGYLALGMSFIVLYSIFIQSQRLKTKLSLSCVFKYAKNVSFTYVNSLKSF